MKKYFILLVFLLPLKTLQAQWIDQSTKLFFPEKEGQMFELYQKMPATWWNFFFYDKSKLSKEEVCEILSKIPQEDILFSPCSPLMVEKKWLQSWAKDNLFNQTPPKDTKTLEALLNKTLVRMSLPQPTDMLDVQRQFPLTDFSKIQKSVGDFYKINEEPGNWGLLPMLFNFSPHKTDQTSFIENLLTPHKMAKSLYFVGPHFGSLANKSQIINDLKKVMSIGFLLLLALFAYLFFTRKKLFFILVPCLFVSVALSSLVVILTWGSIHGLTLAFGSGLIGISMDYAFHGWPERHRSQVWKSNSISFLTTFFAFALLSFFSIPLIKQLSLFALSGLTISFIISFLISLKIPQKLRPQAAKIYPLVQSMKISLFSILILGILFISSFMINNVDFSLMRMDSTQLENKHLLDSSKTHMNKSQYAFLMKDFESLEQLDTDHQWALEQKILYLGPTSLRGSKDSYNQHQSQWSQFVCNKEFLSWKASLSPQLLNIFGDFLKQLDCDYLKSINNHHLQSYLKLFVANQHSLSIFRVLKPEQKQILKSQYPQIFFASDITHNFPIKLKAEIIYFILLVLGAVFITLLFFFKQMAFLAFIPPLGAGAFAFAAHFVIDIPLSFMSFISLIILLGLTLDFGIFSTSCFIWKKPLSRTFGSISLSAMTSLAGFAPLAFCSHPVLRDLGVTITSGVLGAFVATYLIYPGFKRKEAP